MEACGICGNSHSSFSCDMILLKTHIADSPLPSKARLSIPSKFSLKTMTDGSFEIMTNEDIEKGTFFGPLEAPKLLTLNPMVIFPIKVFSDEIEDMQESYFDTTDETACNWLIFISSASCLEEQNLICFQEKSSIIYGAMKDINKGELLKVWYSPYYAKKMKKPLLTARESQDWVTNSHSLIDLNALLIKQQNIVIRKNWTCKFCSKLESDVTKFAHHILDHYLKKTKKICEICNEIFSTKLNLRKHIKIVHPNSPLKKKKSKTKQTLNKDCEKSAGLFGGPLLNNILNDSLDSTNLLMPSMELNSFDLNSNSQILLENDCLNLSSINLLNENDKELNDFHFEINEMQEQHVCDICLNPFSKLKSLIQHLRKHTGQYVCPHCSKVFSRNENLIAHECSEKKVLKFKCDLCDKVYPLKKYLTRHVNTAHGEKISCIKCKKQFSHQSTFKSHNCVAVPDEEKKKYVCAICQKSFLNPSRLHRHMKIHSRHLEMSTQTHKKEICEFCGEIFNSRVYLQIHLKKHKAPAFSCPVCKKQFYRKDVLNNHILLHDKSKMFSCHTCKKTFKTEKYLKNHSRVHVQSSKLFKCTNCNAQFNNRMYLKKHLRKHKSKCQECKKEFTDFEELKHHFATHMSNFYLCPFCDTIVKLKGSLIRHIKRNHTEETQKFDFHGIKEIKHASNSSNEEKAVRNILRSITDEDFHESITLYSDERNVSLSSEYDNHYIENRIETSVDNNLDDIVRNLENVVDIYNANKNSYNEILTVDSLNSNPSNNQHDIHDFEKHKNGAVLIDLQDLDISMDSTINLQQNMDFENLQQAHNICLSMPDLNESNHGISSGIN